MLEFTLGFFIAMAVGLTGVGAGVLTAPALLLLLHTPTKTAVGTALVFGAVVKLVAAPSYLWRKQVNFKVLGWMLLGGLPGVALGSAFLHKIPENRSGLILGLLGAMIALTAGLNLWRMLRPQKTETGADRAKILPWITLPIGAEFGFSSAGAGALGSITLMTLTTLPASQIVGTDVFFGLGLSLIGGGWQFTVGNYDPTLLAKLLAGGVLGALTGSHLSAVLPSRPLRLAMSVWLISLGGQLCYRGLVLP
jgi:uncharacterized protein